MEPSDSQPQSMVLRSQAPVSSLSQLVPAAPGLVRVAASSWRRVLGWSISTSLDLTGQTVKALASGQSPVTVVQGNLNVLRGAARVALGLPALDSVERPAGGYNGHAEKLALTAAELKARGADLLMRSADVRSSEDLHPAYERILEQLAPDEARMLRLLALEGAQPAVDVRTGRPLGIGSELVASGLSMIGMQAGVRQVERTKAYLNNLYRLGLIWFSHEPISDPSRYQVVEVQPEVSAALKSAGRAGRTVRRSIVLTPFGEDFCEVCLPLEPRPGVGERRVVELAPGDD
jgi:hypothetical protein